MLCLLVVLGWCVVDYFGVKYGLAFFSNTHWSLKSPPTSPSNLAEEAFKKHLPHFFQTMPFKGIVVVSTKTEGHSVLTPEIERFAAEFAEMANNNSLSAPWLCFNRQFDSYFTFDTDAERDAARSTYVLQGNETTLMFITTNSGVPNDAKYNYFGRLQRKIDQFLATGEGGGYEISMSYEQLLLRDSKNAAIGDFEKGDMITLPISLLILFAAVGTPALLVLFTLASGGLAGLLVIAPMAKGHHDAMHKLHRVNFASFTPSIFVCMLVAMSLDYALFLLVRYKEEVRKGSSDLAAVRTTMVTAGKVVFLSGTILAASFVGLAFVQFEMISTIGIGGALMIGGSVIANLTLIPSLLVLLGPCFRIKCCSRNCCKRTAGHADDSDRFGVVEEARSIFSTSSSQITSFEKNADKRLLLSPDTVAKKRSETWFQRLKIYYSIGRLAQKHSIACSVMMLVLTAPFLYVLLHMEITTDQSLIVPRNAPSLLAFERLKERSISGGIMSPFLVLAGAQEVQTNPNIKQLPCTDDDRDVNILAIRHNVGFIDSCATAAELGKLQKIDICKKPPGKKTLMLHGIDIHQVAKGLCQSTCPNFCPEDRYRIFSPGFFNALQSFKEQVVRNAGKSGLTMKSFTDITTIENGNVLTPSEAVMILQRNESASSALDKLYQDKFNRLANFERNFVLLEVVPSGPTFDAVGIEALQVIRRVAGMKNFKPYGFDVASDVATVYDSTAEVYRECPTIVLTTVVVIVFVLSGLAFRSFLVACRLLVTISVTVIMVLGITVIIFQGYGKGIYWMIPICCIPLIIGLTLDYDTFLVSRVFEFRNLGYTSEAAILKGLEESGPSITYAGVIMSAAFSALLLSNEYVLNQFGCVLVVSSVIDTFLVRAIFVPALMFLGGDKFIWWPGSPPVPHISINPEGELVEEKAPIGDEDRLNGLY